MRALGMLVVIAACSIGSIAHAETAPELQTKGEELAKTGHFSEAIDAFKAADKIQPTAGHMCLIALVYIRRELWPQAEIHLDLCRARATAQDPLPDWFDEETKQLSERIANVAPIEIVVEPADAKAELTVSSFAPDEQFAPRTIHLPPGHHVIIARAPGYPETQQAIDVEGSQGQRVVIDLRHAPATSTPNPLRHQLLLAGEITLGAGVATYATMGLCWFELRNANDGGTYDRWHGPYEATKYTTWGLWGVGAGLVVAGLLVHPHHETAPVATVAPTSGGGMVVLSWQR